MSQQRAQSERRIYPRHRVRVAVIWRNRQQEPMPGEICDVSAGVALATWPDSALKSERQRRRGHRGVGVSFGFDLTGAGVGDAPASAQPAQRSVPPTRYSDVLGQNAAVEAARDLIELPLKHADLFLRIGAKPRRLHQSRVWQRHPGNR
jgi:hypothetical protein